MIWRAAGMLCAMSGLAHAELSLSFPGRSTITETRSASFESTTLPVGAFDGSAIPTIIAEGPLAITAWRLDTQPPSTLAVTDRLRQQVETVGFELLFECETRACGGFDFRFGIEVLPEPEMHVDLGDFRFFSAQRLGTSTPEYLAVLVSRSSDFAYVQTTHIGFPVGEPLGTDQASEAENAPLVLPQGEFGETLASAGSLVLEDLVFATGSAELGPGDYSSLEELAEFLRRDETLRIVLVGHTDTEGALEGNIALSQKRAESVRRRLIDEYDVPAEQLSAEGIGFLAPRSGNGTETGRAKNRRVEAVLASTR